MTERVPALADDLVIRLDSAIDLIMPVYPDIVKDRRNNKYHRTAQLDDVDAKAHENQRRGNRRVEQGGDDIDNRNNVVQLICLDDHLVGQAEEILNEGAHRQNQHQRKSKQPVKFIRNKKRINRGESDNRTRKNQGNAAHKARGRVDNRADARGITVRERLVERGAGNASDTRLQQRHAADKLRNGRCNAVIGGTEVGKNQARQNKAANRRNNLQQQLKARVQYCFLRSGLTQKLTLYPFILSDKYRLI